MVSNGLRVLRACWYSRTFPWVLGLGHVAPQCGGLGALLVTDSIF